MDKKRPHPSKEEAKEDMIPFKWAKDGLDGKRKAVLYSAKKNNGLN